MYLLFPVWENLYYLPSLLYLQANERRNMFLRFTHSFAAKLNVYILSFLIALFIAGFGTFYHIASQYIEKQTYQKYRHKRMRLTSVYPA